VNSAVLQTIPRTVNTGLGAMFILGALTILGGDSLTDFALALLVGLVVGTASSVFLASPLAIVLDRWAVGRATEPPSARRGRAPSSINDLDAVDPYAHVPTGMD
jgi:SecD/SecF fusion protein